MSEDQIIEQVARLIDPQGDPWCWDEGCRYRTWRSGSMPTHLLTEDCPEHPRKPSEKSLEAARRVVQGLGLREEHETWGSSGVALPGPESTTYTRLVTDWQEDAQ